MTGTAATEAEEFSDIYKLDVVEIPTNRKIQRIDDDDEVYRSTREKYDAIVKLIGVRRPQPAGAVGTTSIEKSELLAERSSRPASSRRTIPTPAPSPAMRRQELRGAERPLSRAGSLYRLPGRRARAVTIATNMAGRGTDIQLGGNVDMRIAQELGHMPEGPERTAAEAAIRADIEQLKQKALAAGGLFVLGTERHESRRIDNQLRGRSGRQGDPGHSKFFLSLEDDLMRILRVGPARRHAAAARPQGRRSHHPSLDQQGFGEGAAEGRGAQLRHPQEPAEV